MKKHSPSKRPAWFFILLAALACNKPVQRTPSSAWEILDLTRIKPAFRIAPGQKPGAHPYRHVETFLGTSEVRNLDLVPPDDLARVPHLPAGLIDGLQQFSGSHLQWPLELGTEPYFSFVPLVSESWAATTEFKVSLIPEEGEPVELLRHREEPGSQLAPAKQVIDLSTWRGTKVRLRLEAKVEAQGDKVPPATWGSPIVAYRRSRTASRTSGPPSILLLGIDTLRADHLGAWGRVPSLTPAIDALAAESDVWLDAFSCFNVTNPSFASIFTGLYGKNHLVYDFQTPLPQEHETLAELLSQQGYSTRAILSARHLRNEGSGLGQGFEEMSTPDSQRSAEMAISKAMNWIADQQGPFFLWVHLFDPHTPHTPPEPYASGLRPSLASGMVPPSQWTPFRPSGKAVIKDPILMGSRQLYEGEVAYVDRQVDRIMDLIKSRGLLSNTIVVLIADHGENLEEHGVSFRHAGLYDSTTHIPLMIRWPGEEREGRRLEGMVQNIDLFPTLLGALKLDGPRVDGVDIRDRPGKERFHRDVVFAEPAFGHGAMVRTRSWKYFEMRGEGITPQGAYLFDLDSDAGEERNLAGQGLEIETRLSRMLARWEQETSASPSPEEIVLDREDLESLRSLGYL